MKKRVGYIMMFLVALLLGGCNLFSGLDKEDLDAPGAFEFKWEEAMANGDYTVAVGLIETKIAASPTLKAVDDKIGTNFTSVMSITSSTSIEELKTIFNTLTAYLNTEINRPEVREYIELKVDQAEGYLGQSGLKMTDIIANITDSTSGSQNLSRNISKSTSTSNGFDISDLVPNGLDSVKLQAAIDSYLKALPTTTGAAFTAIKDEQQLAYLNAGLASAINAINRFIGVFKDDANSTATKVVAFTSGGAFKDDTTMAPAYATKWAEQLPRIRAELQIALMYINLYGQTENSLINETDRKKLEDDFNELINKLTSFTKQDYADFTSQAGLQ